MEGFRKSNKDFNVSFLLKKIKKNSIFVIRKLYKPAFIFVSFQFLVFMFFAVDNFKNIKERFPVLLKYMSLSLDTYELRDYTEYFSNLIGSTISSKKLDRVDISFSFKDKQKLECDRQRKSNCTKDGWVRSSMNWRGEKYKIKLRAKGDRDLHRKSFNEMSFKVDIRGNKRFNGLEEFSIQLPVIRNYTIEAFVANTLQKEKIVSPRHFYVRLFINGEYVGVRHIEEGFSRELIEYSKKRYGPIFSLEETLGDVYENATFDLHDRRKWGDLNIGLPAQALSILNASKSNHQIFDKYFDKKKWATYMAMLDVTKLFHGTVPKSVKFYLNPTTGLIEPIFFDGHYGAGIFDNYHLSDILNNYKEPPDCRWTCPNLYFYQMMFGTGDKVKKDFYILYLNSLEKFTKNDYIKNVFDKGWEDMWLERGSIYREMYRRDGINSYGILPHVGQYHRVKKRFERIRNEINLSKSVIPNHSYDSEKSLIVLENKNSRFPQIYNLYCKDKIITEAKILVKNTPVKMDTQSYQNCNKNNLYFSLNNGLDKTLLSKTIMTDFNLDNVIKLNNISISKNKKNIIYFDKKSNLKDDFIVKNKEVYFKPGVEVCLEDGKVIHLKDSNVFFEGTEKEPNKFLSCNKKIGGAIIFENSNIYFEKLNISKLSSPNLNLRQLYGGINFINSEIKGNTLEVENSLSEDAINFIDSNVAIKNLVLRNIRSDAIDADFSELILGKVYCENVGNDCVDLSFSNGSIDFVESNLVRDKVISLGEKSFLNINKINAKNSEIGLVSKDLSELRISNYNHRNVILPLAAYVKKPEFGEPIVKIKKMFPKNFNLEFISIDSNVIIDKENIIGKNKSQKVSSMLYGNLYGVKTKR